jgi:hypothetical protein
VAPEEFTYFFISASFSPSFLPSAHQSELPRKRSPLAATHLANGVEAFACEVCAAAMFLAALGEDFAAASKAAYLPAEGSLGVAIV